MHSRDWVFARVCLGALVVAGLVLLWVNPAVVAARLRFHRGTKRWDRLFLCAFLPAAYADFVVAVLDATRFRWSSVPDWVCGVGYVPFLAGLGLVTWAEAVNKFFEPTVRIQTDRGHRVIDTGPYAIVRHPGYVGFTLLFLGRSGVPGVGVGADPRGHGVGPVGVANAVGG